MTDHDDGIRNDARERVWKDLRDVALPDSRFGWDFSSFIADYEGSDACATKIRTRAARRGYDSWFVTPDNNLNILREQLIEEPTEFVMPTYGIRRGFLRLVPEDVPDGQAAFASTLDGMTRFASRIELGAMERELPKLDCMVTGASFVTHDGLRMGKGHGFFDLEWAMMREVGLADEETDIVAVVHDVQVVDEPAGQELAASHDTIVDAIVTPDRVIEIDDAPPKPEGIRWPLLERDEIDQIPPLRELWERAGRPALGGESDYSSVCN
jgi:5-formyltetrahydrofolate cyclo-ligase